MSFSNLLIPEFNENVFNLIGKDWMLVTAKKDEVVNPMTIAWGTMGVLWNKPVVIIAIRPERYTFDILEQVDSFSLTAYDKSYQKELGICGSKSGRDIDKVKECNFTVLDKDGVPYFEEARLVIMCKKMYVSQLDKNNFLMDDEFITSWYNENEGYHYLYIAEITDILEKKE